MSDSSAQAAVAAPRIARSVHRDFDAALESYRHVLRCDISGDRCGERGKFEVRASRVVVGGVAISTSSFRGGYSAGSEPPLETFNLTVARAGRVTARQGQSTVLVTPRKTGFMASAREADVSVRMPNAVDSVMASFSASALQASLEAMLGERASERLRFDVAVDLRSRRGAAYLRLLDFLANELNQEETVLRSPPVLASFSDALLHGLLESQPSNYSARLRRAATAAPQHFVARIEEHLAANVAEPVSLGELAILVGMSTRSIQAGFRAHRGYSPMEFLRRRRFELAHHWLCSRPERDVTTVALDCGFTHLGRFSTDYRARYGETPSATRGRHARS